jgi:thymidine kinase
MSKLYFNYGCMGSGKSMFLLATAHNFQEKGIPFIALKPSTDTREGDSAIHSRSLPERECILVDENANIYEAVKNMIQLTDVTFQERLKWVLVDEAQFLTPKQVDELAMIVDLLGVSVLCYGLRTDFKTKMFPGSKRLFEIADTIEEVKSSCHCGNKTIVNARINDRGELVTEGEQVEIGGDDRYISLCRKCYFKQLKNKN